MGVISVHKLNEKHLVYCRNEGEKNKLVNVLKQKDYGFRIGIFRMTINEAQHHRVDKILIDYKNINLLSHYQNEKDI